MKVKFVFFLVVSLIMLGTGVYGQSSSEFWIDIKLGDTSLTMYFGNHVDATYGKDSLNPTLVEKEAPPAPPTGANDVRWVNIKGRVNVWDQGLKPYDYRGMPAEPAYRDSFRIKFQTNIDSNITLSWPDAAYLGARCASMTLNLPDLAENIDMFSVDHVVIEAAGVNEVDEAYIYKNGVNIVDAVKPEKETVPESFGLHQSFPNPFNPSTTVKYDVKEGSFVDISVYNLLGQKVITLVSENHAPGTGYSATWNGVNGQGNTMGTGVYFIRMTASHNGTQEFSSFQKILLVK